MRTALVAAAMLGLVVAPIYAQPSGKSDSPTPGQKQNNPGQAKDFAPGQQQKSPGDAKDSAPGQKQKNPGDAKSFAPGQKQNSPDTTGKSGTRD